MVLLKNDGGLLPLSDDAAPRPHRTQRRRREVQGGGSARVRPERVPGPLDALRARGFDVTFEPGGLIAKTLPVLEAADGFRVELHERRPLDVARRPS